MSYLTVPLIPSHRKGDFKCGKPLLDNYLHNQAKQDVKRKLSACFILPGENNVVKGYYTLSNTTIPQELTPEEIRKKLPQSYRDLPATLLGRLAIDSGYRGEGLGELLLMDALRRSMEVSSQVGSMAVIVDPIDEDALRFYKKYEFISLQDSGKMFLPMTLINNLFAKY